MRPQLLGPPVWSGRWGVRPFGGGALFSAASVSAAGHSTSQLSQKLKTTYKASTSKVRAALGPLGAARGVHTRAVGEPNVVPKRRLVGVPVGAQEKRI